MISPQEVPRPGYTLSDAEADRLVEQAAEFEARGRHDEEADVFARLVAAGWTGFHLDLGLSLLEGGRPNEAREAFRAGAELGFADCRYEYALMLEDEGAVDEARDALESLAIGGHRAAAFALGSLLADAEDFEGAVGVLTPLIGDDDEVAAAAAGLLGVLYVGRGDVSRAEPLLRRGLVYPPAQEALREISAPS